MGKVRTQVTLPSTTWSAELSVANQSNSLNANSAPTRTVGISAIGASAQWQFIEGLQTAYEGEVGFDEWWYRFRFSVSAPGSPGNSASQDFWILGQGPGEYPPYSGGTIIHADTASASIQIVVSGIYLKTWIEENPIYSNGGILSFVERTRHDTWFADENATVTVTATLPDGSQLSVSGPLAEAGQEIELGDNFALSFGWTIHRYDYTDVVYAAVQDVTWGGEPVDFSLCELYNPGADPPDGSQSSWGRTQTQEDCLRIGQYGTGIGTWSHNYQLGQVLDISWTGKVWAPLWVKFVPHTGKHADDVPYEDILVRGTPVRWDEGTESFVQDPFTGEREIKEQKRSWLFEREWRKFSGNGMYLDWDRQDMRDKGEDVGSDDDPNTNNQACALIIHPVNVTHHEDNPLEEWPVFVTLSHEAPIDVVKPPGIPRPADWQGLGGLTPDPANNDLWHVAAGSSEPTAVLDLATRKWARLNRIVHQDPNLENMMKHRDLLIINRPNLDQVGGEYLDPENERIPDNEWHWLSFAYGELQIKAPRDAEIELTVHYSEVSAIDPCYPTLEPGEFQWSRVQKQVKYRLQVPQTPEGQDYSSVIFDLAVPNEGEIAPVLYHVDRIEIKLPPAEQDEDWEFHEIVLSGAYWKDEWGTEPDSFFECREYDPWDFLADYTGFAAVVSGLRCLNIPYGYEEYERTERSLKQRQKWRSRNPEVGILDYAKPLSRLVDELNWQRGWTATYHSPEDSDANEDYEGNRLIGTFRWWDLRRHHEWKFNDPPRSASQELRGAPIVRTWYVAAGIKNVIYYEKFAQGRPLLPHRVGAVAAYPAARRRANESGACALSYPSVAETRRPGGTDAAGAAAAVSYSGGAALGMMRWHGRIYLVLQQEPPLG